VLQRVLPLAPLASYVLCIVHGLILCARAEPCSRKQLPRVIELTWFWAHCFSCSHSASADTAPPQ
jgi:hypothetical protein